MLLQTSMVICLKCKLSTLQKLFYNSRKSDICIFNIVTTEVMIPLTEKAPMDLEWVEWAEWAEWVEWVE